MKKITIITRTIEQSRELYNLLETLNIDIQIVSYTDDNIVNSKIIIPSYLSKGLEFEGVIVYNDPKKTFTQDETNLYYVVCTRAQTQLKIYNEPKYLSLK